MYDINFLIVYSDTKKYCVFLISKFIKNYFQLNNLIRNNDLKNTVCCSLAPNNINKTYA